MDAFVVLKNRRTKKLVTVAGEVWQNKAADWKQVFEVLQTIREPPEVTELKQKQKFIS